MDLNISDPSFDASSFSKNKERLVEHEVAGKFFETVLAEARRRGLLSEEHFTVDGPPRRSRGGASIKGFRPKDGQGDDAGVVLLVATLVPPVLGSIYGWGNGYPWMMGWGFGWMWPMPAFMVAFWGLVIWAVVALVQGLARNSSSGQGASREESDLETLKRRYARGDISKRSTRKRSATWRRFAKECHIAISNLE